MSMNIMGSFSGIDQSTIDQLMEAERLPLKQLERKQSNIVEKKDAWKDINTRLNSLFDKMRALGESSSFNTKIAKSTDENFVSMNAGTGAAEGRYDINIKQLATNATTVGGQIKNVTSDDGKLNDLKITGDFRIKNHDGIEREISVKSGDTLKDVVNKINSTTANKKNEDGKVIKNTGTGISATIIDNRIVLKDEATGVRSITLGGDGQGTLTSLSLNRAARKETEGQDAKFTLNGIKIERSSNRISDAIEGVVINLNKEHAGEETDSITVRSDTEKATKLVQDFVDQYNSTMSFIEEKSKAGDPKVPGSGGVLAGESSLKRLQSSIRTAVTGKFNAIEGSNIKDASQIGISTLDREGTLHFDTSKFLKELGEDKDSVMNFLNPENGEGLIKRVNSGIDLFISKKDGIIKSQNASFERTQKDLAKQIENFEERMVRKEAYYVKTFTALDIAMMKAEDQMGWLIGQVDAMNSGRR